VQGLGIAKAFVGTSSGPTAFNGAFIMTVNGAVFQAPGGRMDISGTTCTSHSSLNMSGLAVNAQFYFDPNSPTLRTIYTYTNNTASPITATIQWQNYLFDGPAVVVSTSAGGTAESVTDSWVVTHSGSSAYIDSVRFGPSAPDTPTIVCAPAISCSGNAGLLIDQYSLTVPARQTRALMFFGRLSATSTIDTSTFDGAGSLTSAGLLNNLPAGLQQSQIVNWFGGSSGTPTTTIPATNPFSFLLTAALMTALGIKYVKKVVA
jgi:hypothetical protein